MLGNFLSIMPSSILWLLRLSSQATPYQIQIYIEVVSIDCTAQVKLYICIFNISAVDVPNTDVEIPCEDFEGYKYDNSLKTLAHQYMKLRN